MDKPIRLSLPYPEPQNLVPDPKTAAIIAPAYAGAHGELTATLQYIYHHFNFLGIGDEKTASVLVGIAVAEMQHLDILGKMLYGLGADPVFTRMPPYRCDFYSSSFVNYSRTSKKMLLDDLAGEMTAIKEYRKMLRVLNNEEVAATIERIVLDEELHVKVLKDRLYEICPQGNF